MTTETQTNVYEKVLANMKKAAESGVKMQQDAFQQWTAMWPGMPSSQSAWMEQMKDFQKQWTETVSAIAHEHRNVLDQQYDAALESLEEALKVTDATNPEEFRQRTEQFCRKSLACMKEATEAQMKEYQDAMKKWSELVSSAKA